MCKLWQLWFFFLIFQYESTSLIFFAFLWMSCQVKDFGYDNSCGTLSEATFMHTGYTGGCICVDPVLEAFTLILTNRCVTSCAEYSWWICFLKYLLSFNGVAIRFLFYFNIVVGYTTVKDNSVLREVLMLWNLYSDHSILSLLQRWKSCDLNKLNVAINARFLLILFKLRIGGFNVL